MNLSLRVKRLSRKTESILKKSSPLLRDAPAETAYCIMLAGYFGNFPADDARNAVSRVRGGIFAETLREATVVSAEQ